MENSRLVLVRRGEDEIRRQEAAEGVREKKEMLQKDGREKNGRKKEEVLIISTDAILKIVFWLYLGAILAE